MNSISLSDTAITDAGLAGLRRPVQLQWVELAGTKITVTAFDHLEHLPDLRYVGVYRTATTREEAVALREHHPQVRFPGGYE